MPKWGCHGRLGIRCVSRSMSRASVFFSVLAISACSTVPSMAPSTIGTVTREPAALANWQASGRLAVSSANAGGSGSFTWMQRGTDATVQIRGPVGVGSLRLVLSDRTMRIVATDGEEYVAADAERELASRLGASVPAQDLRYWLIGVAAPGEHQWTTTTDFSTLTQHQWRIDYQRYAVTDGVRLPMKLVAVSGPAKVRIVIDKWTVE